ncbi:MAG TPA: adenylate/guanylate cyclase domain-containing protein, partial [Acidimicrobiales bacterium]
LLRTHTGAGRLDLDEFSDLAGEVFAARTRRELEKVLEGLPPGVEAAEPVVPPVPAVPEGSRPPRKLLIAIMNGSNTRGRWRAPAHITAFAFWGSVKVDLRSAAFDTPVIDIYAWAIMGGVDVVVPAGVAVELDGMVVMGGSGDRTRPGPVLPGTPLVRVHARGLWGGVGARTGKPRGERGGSSRSRDRDRDRHRHGHAHAPAPPPIPTPPTAPPPGLPMPNLSDLIPQINIDIGRRQPAPRSRERMQPHPRYRNNGDDGARTPTDAPPVDADAAPAAGPSGTLTMMVTDIVGSTRLAEALGDRRWMDLMNDHNALVREQVAKHGGTEVKAQGDGFLVVFASARRAILAAVDIQRALAEYRDGHPDHPLDMRIGLHTGEIVDVDGDVFGQNVVVAVRIADHAAPGEILVSGLTRDLTQAGGDLCFDDGHELDLKGLSQPWRVHRVSWSTEPA